MSRITTAAVLAALIGLSGFAGPALAHDKGSIQHKNHFLRSKVIKLHGKRAPGRDIVKFGLRSGKKASKPKIHKYFGQLRALIDPPVYLAVNAGPPRRPPAGTQTANMSATGLAACIVHYESTGNPQASNGTHSGLAAWSPEAWSRMGGTRYASTPTGASRQQQLIVLSNGLRRFGCRDWCPYDPC